MYTFVSYDISGIISHYRSQNSREEIDGEINPDITLLPAILMTNELSLNEIFCL